MKWTTLSGPAGLWSDPGHTDGHVALVRSAELGPAPDPGASQAAAGVNWT